MASRAYDNRRSGRTTRMLAAAMRHCFDGGVSFVVIPRGMFEELKPVLKDMGATYICQHRRFAEFGKDAKIQFKVLQDEDVNTETFEVRGIKEEHVFWDHEAVRQAHNRTLMKYHEYD